MNKYSISKKKIDKLYDLIHSEIMDLRIKIAKMPSHENHNSIDRDLAELCYEIPEKVINLFLKSEKNK